MPTLTESLEKRIRQLRASIEAQQRQLAAYEGVLALERGPSAARTDSGEKTAPAGTPSSTGPEPVFTGNKTEFVAALVAARGESGVTPKELDAAFAQRGIAKGRKLISRALRSLVQQKRVKKQGDRYVALHAASKTGRSTSAPSRRGAARAARPAQASPKRASASKATSGTRAKSTPQAKKPAASKKAPAKKAASKRAA